MLPATIVSVSVAAPIVQAAAALPAALPLTVQLVRWPCMVVQAAAGGGGVAADGAVGQVAVPLLYRPPPLLRPVLPLTVQLVSVAVPWLSRPPPPVLPAVVADRDRQSPSRRRDTAVDLEHPAGIAAADVRPAAGPVIVSVPLVSVS